MTRSLKKGPFIDAHLVKKSRSRASDQRQEASQNLVAPLDDHA
jgi:ribosomal protein S19